MMYTCLLELLLALHYAQMHASICIVPPMSKLLNYYSRGPGGEYAAQSNPNSSSTTRFLDPARDFLLPPLRIEALRGVKPRAGGRCERLVNHELQATLYAFAGGHSRWHCVRRRALVSADSFQVPSVLRMPTHKQSQGYVTPNILRRSRRRYQGIRVISSGIGDRRTSSDSIGKFVIVPFFPRLS